ncbi:ABC transporter permease [Halostella litorea]|uniref:ABC transporter permease n=1 Tax=Halostella litorea TaxID=2528831 RepID=UPI0010925346|nr:ABC transporter permease [Halostella litorea]
MSRKSASLLTKTQRRRLRNDFEELDETKKRRDQQRIRDRLRAGTLDFRLLVDLPDDQLELAFDGADDEELRDALSDAYLTIERIRELEEYPRDELIENARGRAADRAETRAGLRSLDDLTLRTEPEIRDRAETETAERLAWNRWTSYANRLMGVGALGFLLSAVFWTSDRLLGTRLWSGNDATVVSVFVLVFLGVAGWTAIMTANALRHDILPLCKRLVQHPNETLRDLWVRWVPKGVRTAVTHSEPND